MKKLTSLALGFVALACSSDRAEQVSATDPVKLSIHDPACSAPELQVFGMNINQGDPNPAALRAAGVRWARIEYKSDNLAAYPDMVSSLRREGIRVLLLVDYMTVSGAPGTNGSSSAWDAYTERFVAGVEDAARRFGGSIDAWEIWNEPDLAPSEGYDPGVPAEKYGPMLRGAYRAIKQFTDAPVIVGGLASGNLEYLDNAVQAAGSLYADGIGIHPYGQRAPDGWPSADWGFGNLSQAYSATYQRFHKRIWVTELGTMDTARAAEYLEHVYDLTRSNYLSTVPVVFWFCWDDRMVSPFGLLDVNGQQKSLYQAYRDSAPAWDPACGGFDSSITDLPDSEDEPAGTVPPSGTCPCRASVDNFCLYGVDDPECPPTQPGGYCDWNGDHDFADADWSRGYSEYQAACAGYSGPTPEPGDDPTDDPDPPAAPSDDNENEEEEGEDEDEPGQQEEEGEDEDEPGQQEEEDPIETLPPSGTCPCRTGVDNFCLYGADDPECPPTQPGGYCDRNGDHDFTDADWDLGYAEYQAACAGFSDSSPLPSEAPVEDPLPPTEPSDGSGDETPPVTSCASNCSTCVLDERPDILPFYASNGWDTACENHDVIVADWSGIDPTGAFDVRRGACAAACTEWTDDCGSPCTQCVLGARSDLVPFYVQSGWTISCTSLDAIVTNWCGIDPLGCAEVEASLLCAEVCQ